MNCSNCGATNDADARFCAECGAPLENEDVEATIAGQVFLDADNDETILSTPGMLAAEEAKTVSVDQTILADAQEDAPAPLEPEYTLPPSAASSTPTGFTDDDGSEGGDDGEDGRSSANDAGGGNRRTIIIISVVVLLVILCCCCCSIAVGTQIDPNNIEDLLREFTLLPTYLPFVV
jgi:hypothetical protein